MKLYYSQTYFFELDIIIKIGGRPRRESIPPSFC
jgi:hypothetical protein